MKITSSALLNGSFEDKYGKRGNDFKGSMPCRSIPFEIIDFPQNTISFAFVLEDSDSIHVCGFTWVHWLGARLIKTQVVENESLHTTDFVQGKNSWGENLYGGMSPPNAPHTYILTVFALDFLPDLKDGFTKDTLLQSIDGHILEKKSLGGIYHQ